jgi:V/A-type H+/Na+-transporting ATPase subunit D
MAKIKHTKNELKAQNEALARYQRFLPMLQLKKQQLQAEIQAVDTLLDARRTAFASAMEGLSVWASLFAEPIDLESLLTLDGIETENGNIAGVNIPIFKSVLITRAPLDLFATPTWLDDAQDALSSLMELRAEIEILEEQRRLIGEELRMTSQRVNLFEKVKIPECRENIRVIKIFLGDEQTAAVARGKLAKKRSEK